VPASAFPRRLYVTRPAEALRARANHLLQNDQPRISLTAIITRACAWALKRHPFLNSRLEGQQILLLQPVNIGIAVALDNGLIVPVIRNADEKNVLGLQRAIVDLASRARAKRAQTRNSCSAPWRRARGVCGTPIVWRGLLRESGPLEVGRDLPAHLGTIPFTVKGMLECWEATFSWCQTAA